MTNELEQNSQRVGFAMHGHVGVLTMQHHEQHNALGPLQVKAFLAAHSQSLTQKARALVITSSDKHFCAGADINEFLKGQLLNPQAPVSEYAPMVLFKTLIDDSRPIIAAVNGAALGGGVELVLCSDMVLATPAAKFGMPEISLGILPRTATVRLSEIIGRRRALEMILTRRRVDANEALTWGLINRAVPASEFEAAVEDYVTALVELPPLGVRYTKSATNLLLDAGGFSAHLDAGAPMQRYLGLTPDSREAKAAFNERRKPHFTGEYPKTTSES
jgi:enoyl-CoA hydratase/carnithine racemase